ncbi:MAG: hypothetical protein M1830_000746 [Pleopsidium flavum]|nr:MAG: hypothetical protein M1830_000746 [Pleopsidium flavum]
MASTAEELNPPFMRLPLELRRQIYQYLLPDRTIDSIRYPNARGLGPYDSRYTVQYRELIRKLIEKQWMSFIAVNLFACALRLYIPRIGRLLVQIDDPRMMLGARNERERLYDFKDNIRIRWLCSHLVNTHNLDELIIKSPIALPIWPEMYLGKGPPPRISDVYDMFELLGILRNVQHVRLEVWRGVSVNKAADKKLKDTLRLMRGDSPPPAPHHVEILWERLPSITAKLTGANLDEEIRLARCSRENRDLPGFGKAIQQMVEKEMARRKEADRALEELYSVQQGLLGI